MKCIKMETAKKKKCNVLKAINKMLFFPKNEVKSTP